MPEVMPEVTRDAEVVIAGGGPTGLLLACELRLAGVRVLVLDRLPARNESSRAGGIHGRTLELLEQRGILDRFLEVGRPVQAGHFSWLWLDFSTLPTRFPYCLGILQNRTEQVLEQRAAELGVRVQWDTEVTGVTQQGDEVRVDVRTGTGSRTLRARYLVGCDGGRSTVRKLAGIGFPGTEPSLTALLGDVELDDPHEREFRMERTEHGEYSVIAFEPGWRRVMVVEHHVTPRTAPATFEDLRAAMLRVAGTDLGMRNPRWVSRFNDSARQAERYRAGRVLLAGDAAHIHYPAGGQGLNLGAQDAMNLGWKLAMVLAGHAPDSLLDTYQEERHPAAARVLENTRAQSALGRPDPQTGALREVMRTLIEQPSVSGYFAGMITALDVHYPAGAGHPLTGRRMPDLRISGPDGEGWISALLHPARPVLLDLGGLSESAAASCAGWQDRVDLVRAGCAQSRWTVPGLGEVDRPGAVLLRPDGYVAWAVEAGQEGTGLDVALRRWFGPSRSTVTATG